MLSENTDQTSPSNAVCSIVSSYAQSTRTTAKKQITCARLQRCFEVNITGGNLLEELKVETAAKKPNKLTKTLRETRLELTANRWFSLLARSA
jgi:hypothetical protein